MHLTNLLGNIVHRKVKHVWKNLETKAADLLSMWTLSWEICIKNQHSSKATESKGLFPNLPSGIKGIQAN